MLNGKETVIWALQAFVCVPAMAEREKGEKLKGEKKKNESE